MGKPKKVIEENNNTELTTASSPIEEIKTPKQRNKKQICPVLYKTDKKFALQFEDGGISYRDNSPAKTDKVEVTYIGVYGEKSFKILSYKFI